MHLQAMHSPFSFINKPNYDPPGIIQSLTSEAIVTASSPLKKNIPENAAIMAVPAAALQQTHSNNIDVAELHDMLRGKEIGFPELDCLKEHEGMSWWGSSCNNGFDDKSSSSSWDSASVVLQHDAVLRGYGIEYNL